MTTESSPERPGRSKDDERVLVVPTATFKELGEFQGFLKESLSSRARLFAPETARFARRGDAEFDPSFKQLIPYVLFVCETGGEKEIFAYRRGEGHGEARLRSKWSVGVGGHINDSDLEDSGDSLDLPRLALSGGLSSDEETPFERGARREIAEEVVLGSRATRFEVAGLVNDDSAEVGRVHLGVVCVVRLESPILRSNEPDLLEARFRPLDEIAREIERSPERFESWTTLALQGGAVD